MTFTTSIDLTSKSKLELRGLYALAFNKVADPSISDRERRLASALLFQIRQLLACKR